MIQRQRPQRQLNSCRSLYFSHLLSIAADSGTYLALHLFGGQNDCSAIPEIITVEVIITATPLQTKFATVAPINAGRAQVDLPADIAAEARDGQTGAIDPNALGARDGALGTPTVSIAGGPVFNSACEFYNVLAATPLISLRCAKMSNWLTSCAQTDSLSIPPQTCKSARGCSFRTSAARRRTNRRAYSRRANRNRSPASRRHQHTGDIAIRNHRGRGFGDITAEAVRLRNNGGTINISDWTLSDSAGNTFTFYNMLLFPQTSVVLYTRSGTPTADARFWGRQESVWEAGEELTLRDAEGRILQTLALPVSDPGP